MTQSDKFALLKDLASLLKKHGPTAFTELADFLRNPAAVTELISILKTSGAAARRAGITRPSGKGESQGTKGIVKRLLANINDKDPEKANPLSTFYDMLSTKRVLPTMRDLRDFADDNGLRPVTASSRDKAILPLLKDLATRSAEDIHGMLQQIRSVDTQGDRTLEGWTDVILGKHRP